MNTLMRATCLILLACWCVTGYAATVCVDSAVSLVAAINDMGDQPDGSIYTIKIVQGTYNVDGAMNVPANGEIDWGVRILGGYTTGCANRVINPSNTVLDARNFSSNLHIVSFAESGVIIEGLTLTRVRHASVGAIVIFGNEESSIEVRHCRVTNSQVDTGILLWGAGKMKVTNSLIADNAVAAEGAGVQIEYRSGGDSAAIVNNNTIANNTGGAGLSIISADGTFRTGEVANNILYGNSIDLNLLNYFYTGNSLAVRGNLYGTLLGTPLTSDNIVANPMFVDPANSDYSVALISPAINSGEATQIYDFPARDIINRTRIVGSRVDRGAYESPQDDLNGFIVSTTADNGNNVSPTPGSLRAAIKAGNAAGVPYKVSFELNASCPAVITVSTALPDITGNVTIDGRTQTGWSPNTGYGAFDATLCVVLNGSGSVSVPWAFHVPSNASNAQLTIKGMALSGFTDAAIKLEGGHDHHLQGNQIGGIPFTNANDKGVYVGGNASGSYVGGFDDPSSVNLISGTDTAGIYLENTAGGSVIANNLIGFQTDGLSPLSNGIGIYLFNSPSNLISYNYVGNSDNAGIQISGPSAQLNIVQANNIGVNRLGGAAGNASAGVALSFAAQANTIGAPASATWGGNFILYNNGPGVWVTPSGGAGNRVLSGNFYSNGGLAIDLDGSGPTTNPGAPGSSGPNLRQAHPILTQALRSAAGTTGTLVGSLSASRSNTSYRFDIYHAAECGANGRGVGGYPLAKFNATTNASGQVSINAGIAFPFVMNLGAISATATDPDGNTSEIGSCVMEVLDNNPDVFSDGFE